MQGPPYTPTLSISDSIPSTGLWFDEMCFFNQKVFQCQDWKWGPRREACSMAPQIGESCGIKLIMDSQRTNQLCSICRRIEIKRRRIRKLEERIKRWSTEPEHRKSSIKAAEQEIYDIALASSRLDMRRPTRLYQLTNASRGSVDCPISKYDSTLDCLLF